MGPCYKHYLPFSQPDLIHYLKITRVWGVGGKEWQVNLHLITFWLQFKIFRISLAPAPWLMPAILATQEAEINNLSWKPTRANSSGDPILKKHNTKNDWWSVSRWRPWVQAPVPQKKKKKKFRVRVGDMTQVVERLLGKHEAKP
jgi:hypothetical protein